MDIHTATECAYKNGYEAGKQAALDSLREGIQTLITDDETDVIISEGEVFVPISAVRKLVK